jgi:hypothetical protein
VCKIKVIFGSGKEDERDAALYRVDNHEKKAIRASRKASRIAQGGCTGFTSLALSLNSLACASVTYST